MEEYNNSIQLGTGLYNVTNHTNFILEIPDVDLTKAFRANIQATDLPGINVPATKMSIKEMGITDGSLPSAHMEYEPFTVRVLMDEEFESYINIYKWMSSHANPNDGPNTAYAQGVEMPKAMLHILNNNKSKIIMTFVFEGLFPESINGLSMDYTESGHTITTVNVILNFKRLWLERNGDIIGPNNYIGNQPKVRV